MGYITIRADGLASYDIGQIVAVVEVPPRCPAWCLARMAADIDALRRCGLVAIEYDGISPDDLADAAEAHPEEYADADSVAR